MLLLLTPVTFNGLTPVEYLILIILQQHLLVLHDWLTPVADMFPMLLQQLLLVLHDWLTPVIVNGLTPVAKS